MADLFGRDIQNIQVPITADRATLTWGGTIVSSAIGINVSFNQGITRRRTIGNKQAVIYASQPAGTIQISRLLTNLDGGTITTLPGWNVCSPTTISISLGSCTGASSVGYTATGCVVSSFSLAADAESLTVVDNVTIEFLQLSSS